MLTIIKTIKFSRHPPPYHLSKRQKLKDDFKDSFELGLWISLAFLWITSWIIFEGTAGGGISTTKVLFLKILKLSFAILAFLLLHHFQIAVRGVPFFLHVAHIVICDIAFLFVQHALVNIAGGKLWSLVNSRSHSLHLNFLLDTRDHDCRHTLQDHKKKDSVQCRWHHKRPLTKIAWEKTKTRSDGNLFLRENGQWSIFCLVQEGLLSFLSTYKGLSWQVFGIIFLGGLMNNC